MMNHYEIIEATKEAISKEVKDPDFNENEVMRNLLEKARKTKSINQEASLITVMSIGLHLDWTGDVDFDMPLTKWCLKKFKHIKRELSRGVTTFECYSSHYSKRLVLQKSNGYWISVVLKKSNGYWISEGL